MEINANLHTFMYSLAEALAGDAKTENGIYSHGWLYLYKQLADKPFDVSSLYKLVYDIIDYYDIDTLAYRDRMSVGFTLLTYVLRQNGVDVPEFNDFMRKLEKHKFHKFSSELIGVLSLMVPEQVSRYINEEEVISKAIQGYPRPLYMLIGKAIEGKISPDIVSKLKSNRMVFERLYKRKNLEYLAIYLAIVSQDLEESKLAYNALRELLDMRLYDIISSLREYIRVMDLAAQGALGEIAKGEYQLFKVVGNQLTVKMLRPEALFKIRADVLAKALIAIHLSGYDNIIALPRTMDKYIRVAEELIEKKNKLMALLNIIYGVSSISLGALATFLSSEISHIAYPQNILIGLLVGIPTHIIENIVIPFSRLWLRDVLSNIWKRGKR